MPRTARRKSISGIYHIILRGINRQTIFEDKEDAEKFLQTIKDCKMKSGYKLYGYCSMGNHIHLLIKEEKEDLGIIMRRIGARYVYWYNWKYNRYGHLFQDRYKSEVVENESYFLTVLRYIHQNPLKAGLVKDIKEYRWSSYSEFIEKNIIVDIDFVLDLFNKDRKKAVDNFKTFHEISCNDNCLDIEDKRRVKDNQAIEIIRRLCHVSHCSELQILERNKRNKCIKIIKEYGLPTRQIARLTGVSRGIILKI